MVVPRTLVPMLAVVVPALVGCELPQAFRTSFRGPEPTNLTVEEEQKFDTASDELKNPSRFFLSHAKLLEGAGQLDKARNSYAYALKEDPRSKDALLGLARLDQLAGRTKEAEDRYLRMAAAFPGDPDVLDAIGQFFAAEKRWGEATAALERASAAAPNDDTIRYHLAVATARGGNIEAARPLFARTVGIAETHYNLGYILYEAGNLDAAEREFIAAIAKQPELEEAQVLLGELRSKRGDGPFYAEADIAPITDTPIRATPQGSGGTGQVRTAAESRFRGTDPGRVRQATSTAPQPEAFEEPVRRGTSSSEFDAIPQWNPDASWGNRDPFEKPVRTPATGNPAQLEQWRNQQ